MSLALAACACACVYAGAGAAAWATPAAAAPAIVAEPAGAVLEGQPLALRLTGLMPGQVATLHAARLFERYPRGDEPYRGLARFTAAEDGTVDLARAAPMPGSHYARADAAGLFWSMQRVPAGDPTVVAVAGSAPMHPPMPAPVPVPVPGIVALALEVEGRVVARLDLALPRVGAGVVVQDVRESGVVGVFAHLPGAPRRSALVLLGGSEGGLFTARSLAPLLASHGFAVLGIATFQRHAEEPLPLPRSQEELPIEALAAARRWLQMQPGVVADTVAVLGVSKGAELALVAATRYPWIHAVAAFAPSHVVWEGVPAATTPAGAAPAGPRSSWSFEGRALPFVRWSAAAERRGARARAATGRSRLTEAHLESLAEYAADVPAASIPVEQANAAFFLAAGIDDGMWPAAYAAERLAARLQAAGYRHPVQLERVDSGHQLLGTGWAPTTAAQGGRGRLQGGSAALDAAAQALLWPRLIDFLRRQRP